MTDLAVPDAGSGDIPVRFSATNSQNARATQYQLHIVSMPSSNKATAMHLGLVGLVNGITRNHVAPVCSTCVGGQRWGVMRRY